MRMAASAAAFFDAWRNGVFGTIDGTRCPLVQAAQAHRDIAGRRKTGTIVLVA